MKHLALSSLSLLAFSAMALADPVELGTLVPGVVETVLVKPGQRVQRGAPLLKLESTRLVAKLEEADAQMVRAEVDLADAQRLYDRAQELYQRTVSSTTELEAATLRRDRAAADARAAKARRALARKDLDDATLIAPFSGVVRSIAAPGTVTRDCAPQSLATMER